MFTHHYPQPLVNLAAVTHGPGATIAADVHADGMCMCMCSWFARCTMHNASVTVHAWHAEHTRRQSGQLGQTAHIYTHTLHTSILHLTPPHSAPSIRGKPAATNPAGSAYHCEKELSRKSVLPGINNNDCPNTTCTSPSLLVHPFKPSGTAQTAPPPGLPGRVGKEDGGR